MSHARRGVVTGLGVVSSLGCDVATFWTRCLEGASAVAPIPALWARDGTRSRHYAPLGTWEQAAGLTTRLERKRLDPSARMAIQAAAAALAHAGLAVRPRDDRREAFRIEGLDEERTGVYVGTGIGGFTSCLANASFVAIDAPRRELLRIARRLREEAPDAPHAAQIEAACLELPTPRQLNPFVASMAMPNTVAAALTSKLGARGPCPTSCCACASGTVALGQALRGIRAGECDLALAVGAEYMADTYGAGFRAFDSAGALAHGPLAADEINRPFDARRSGFLFAEGGAAVLVIEELGHARARGAQVLAEVLGFGETGDGHSLMAMAPGGAQVRRAILRCLADAGLEPGAIDYVNAHGTSTPSADAIESEVLFELFGERPWINSTKSLLGHTLGASGALEAVVTVLSLRDGTTHACRNLVDPVGPGRFVRDVRPLPLRHALSESFAFGGHNAVLAFGPAPDA